MSKEKPQGLPANVVSMLAEADKRNGFPPGTMQSVMQQEVGGNVDKYLNAPDTYHYAPNAQGQRIAGHTGKVSTAFGPFGILESTGRDPGYGVKPLANKSLDEQVRFAADYLAARSKQAGGLAGGLAGYGEGAKYSSQVTSRLGGVGTAAPAAQPGADLQVAAISPAQDMGPGPVILPPEMIARLSAPAASSYEAGGPDAWTTFLKSMPGRAQPVNVADIDYENPRMATRMPEFQLTPAPNRKPNFEAFGSWTGRAA